MATKKREKSNQKLQRSARDQTRLVTRRELARLLKVSVSSVDRLSVGGQIPTLRIGRRVVFHYAEVLSAIKAQSSESSVDE